MSTDQVKERPILFSAPMVRALLAGTKTQIRRVVKPQPSDHHWHSLPGYELKRSRMVTIEGRSAVKFSHSIPQNPGWDDASSWICCPYGAPGTKLWVREAWRAPASCNHLQPCRISDSEAMRFMADETVGPDPGFGKGRPGMFMPRWASRITLEVTEVRVERLHDISEADALAEGVHAAKYLGLALDRAHARAYSDLWESINGAGSWDANPWVWCVSFRRVTSP